MHAVELCVQKTGWVHPRDGDSVHSRWKDLHQAGWKDPTARPPEGLRPPSSSSEQHSPAMSCCRASPLIQEEGARGGASGVGQGQVCLGPRVQALSPEGGQVRWLEQQTWEAGSRFPVVSWTNHFIFWDTMRGFLT